MEETHLPMPVKQVENKTIPTVSGNLSFSVETDIFLRGRL
jgi:hypothetical protein